MNGIRRVTLLLVTLTVVAGCTSSAPRRSAAPASPAGSAISDSTPTSQPWPGPTSDLSSLSLPPGGVVVDYETVDRPPSGIVLASLDGRLLANLPNVIDVGNAGVPSPLVLRGSAADYRLGAGGGRLTRVPDSELDRWPLAYGAAVVHRGATPGTIHLVARGKDVAYLGNGNGEPSYAVSNDLDLVTVYDSRSSTLFDLRTSTRQTLPIGCYAADRHGDYVLLLCDNGDRNSRAANVQLLHGKTRTTIVGRGAPGAGGWRKAMYSNDRTTILLEWAAPCAHPSASAGLEPDNNEPTAFLADADGANLRRVGTGDRVQALGWSGTNEAIVAASFDRQCGDPLTGTVDAIPTSGTRRQVFSIPAGIILHSATLWQPALV